MGRTEGASLDKLGLRESDGQFSQDASAVQVCRNVSHVAKDNNREFAFKFFSAVGNAC